MPAWTRTTVAALAVVFAACSSSPAMDPDPAPVLSAADKAALAALAPQTLPAPPRDVSNSHADDAAAARLGQKFFMDPGFSGKLLDGDNDGSPSTLGTKGDTGKVSCAGCHVPGAGFLDNRTIGKQISLAAGWNLRRTPSLLDVGQAKVIMWDGRHDTLYNQPFGPIENPTEMNSGRLYVAEQIFARYRTEYEAIFGSMPDLSLLPQITAATTGCNQLTGTPACHGKPGDGAEYDSLSAADKDAVTRVVVNLGKAIGAYERLLTCGQGRFDAWVNGDATALTHSEQRGAQLFVSKAQCATCHSGPFLTDQKFHDVGLRPAQVAVVFTDSNDHGALPGLTAANADPLNVRGAYSDGDDGRLVEPTAAMDGAFRTPGLRCASKRPSFMHTAQFSSFADVVDFFNRGGHVGGYPGVNEIAPLGLTAQEQSDLVSFLGSLDGPGPAAALLTP
jgi:cytochrome c peroxidase